MRCLEEGSYLCNQCRQLASPLALHKCVVCGNKSPRGLTCWECRRETVLTGAVSFGTYRTAWIKRGVGWLKFKSVKEVAPVLGALMAWPVLQIAPLKELQARAVLVPIPLHEQREKIRGFNQSEEIVRSLAQASGIPWVNLLERTRPTSPQAQIEKNKRKLNVEGAFKQVAPLSANHQIVILVDDVLTTGATMEAAANSMEPRQHSQTWALTMARG